MVLLDGATRLYTLQPGNTRNGQEKQGDWRTKNEVCTVCLYKYWGTGISKAW